jgi:GNAT superfamily N-acetyltransferase
MAMSEWTIRSATLADRDAAIVLMDRAFGPAKHRAELWDWAFAKNPHTRELYYLLADTGRGLAAQYAAVPVAMQHLGQPIRGLLSLFTATDPDFQRRGLFRTLAQTLYDNARDTCPLVFGFPNENSAPSFYKHLGWVDLRPFPDLRRPLRNSGRHSAGNRATALGARALEVADRFGRDRSITIVQVDDFSGIADLLWEQIRHQVGTAIIRGDQFLNWRFVRSPFHYIRLVAMRKGKPAGLAVIAADSSDGKARLMEFIVNPSEGLGVTRALLARVVELATASGAYGLGFVATPRHPQYKALLAAGLVPVISVRRPPSPIDQPIGSFGVRVNSPGVAPSRVLHIDDWFLSGADQDWL